MPSSPQTRSNHTRWLPAFHFFAIPVLLINAIVALVALIREPSGTSGWAFVVAAAIVTAATLSRTMPLTAQDRLIRFEETLRMQRVLPPDLQSEISSLSRTDFVALRFASDGELADLVRRVRKGEFRSQSEIKKAVKDWRPDYLRV